MVEGGEKRGGGVGWGLCPRRGGAGYHAACGAVRYPLRCGPGGDRTGAGGAEGSCCENTKGGSMKERGVKRLRIAACVLAGLILGGTAAAQNPLAAKSSEKKSPPPAAAAQKFLDEAESRFVDLNNKAQRASWVEENFITDDTEEIAAEANQELNTFSAEMSKKAHDFDKVALPPVMARKMLLLKLSSGFPAPADAKEQKELAQVLASLDGDYGKGKWCPDGDASKCLDVTAVWKLMAKSRDPEELKRAWIGWHAVGAPMRQRYARMAELGNKGWRELGVAESS